MRLLYTREAFNARRRWLRLRSPTVLRPRCRSRPLGASLALLPVEQHRPQTNESAKFAYSSPIRHSCMVDRSRRSCTREARRRGRRPPCCTRSPSKEQKPKHIEKLLFTHQLGDLFRGSDTDAALSEDLDQPWKTCFRRGSRCCRVPSLPPHSRLGVASRSMSPYSLLPCASS